MKTLSIIAAVATLFSATLAQSTSTTFSITAVSYDPTINGQAVNANSGNFWINASTEANCKPGSACPNPLVTIFAISQSGRLDLSVLSTIEQKVSVGGTGGNGLLIFDTSYYADVPYHTYTGFELVNGYLKFENRDFCACWFGSQFPNSQFPDSQSVYVGDCQIYNVKCVQFQAKYSQAPGPAVWSYL